MNPFTRFLSQWSGNRPFSEFVARWDELELVVVRVHREKMTLAEAEPIFAEVWHLAAAAIWAVGGGVTAVLATNQSRRGANQNRSLSTFARFGESGRHFGELACHAASARCP